VFLQEGRCTTGKLLKITTWLEELFSTHDRDFCRECEREDQLFESHTIRFPTGLSLPEKDIPIFLAAIEARARRTLSPATFATLAVFHQANRRHSGADAS
jgi:hypothetical protein